MPLFILTAEHRARTSGLASGYFAIPNFNRGWELPHSETETWFDTLSSRQYFQRASRPHQIPHQSLLLSLKPSSQLR